MSVELLSKLEIYAEKNHIPIIKPETAAFLRTVCAEKRPAKILEIGTAIGYSAIIMAEYLTENGRIDTIEIDEDIAAKAGENIKKAGYGDKIRIIAADAVDVLKCIDKKYDIVFLDAAKGQYKAMLGDIKRMIDIGGILISDNISFGGKVFKEGDIKRKSRTIVVNMREYIRQLTEDRDFETELLDIGDGIAFSVKV